VGWKARLLIVARFAGVRHDVVIGHASVELSARLQGSSSEHLSNDLIQAMYTLLPLRTSILTFLSSFVFRVVQL
jgi:hypothetical protein